MDQKDQDPMSFNLYSFRNPKSEIQNGFLRNPKSELSLSHGFKSEIPPGRRPLKAGGRILKSEIQNLIRASSKKLCNPLLYPLINIFPMNDAKN